MPHGRCFVIHQSEVLATEVLPRFFNQTKFLSFIRQLNLWGFKRLTRGVDGKAYYHELFLRGRPYLALRLKRMKIKGHGFKPIPNPTGEPNFYNGFPPVGDTMTIGFASREQKASSPKAKVGGVRTKKQIVMNHTESATINQTNRAGFVGGGLSWDATTDGQWHVPGVCNDSMLLMPALSKLAPTASIFSAGLQSTTGDAKKETDASITNTNPTDPTGVDILALLRSHQLALSATNAQASQISSELTSLAGLKPAVVASPFADQLAAFVRLRNEGDCLGQRAIANARLAVLAGLQTTDNTHQGNISGLAAQIATLEGLQHTDGSQIRLKSSASNTGVDLQNAHLPGSCNSTTAQPKIEDCLLSDRLSQFRREQEEMALMRNARFYEELASSNNVNMTHLPFSGLQALLNSTDLNLNSNYDQRQPQSYLANGHIPYISRTTQAQHGAAATSLSSITDPVTVSVTEALREANHLEELALASRARARNIALAGALEVQSRYDAFLKNPLNGQENEGRSSSNIK
ncbi:hypothetical protein HJC23_004902 [Cyclotella cryptica]|uniref:HSF-type DNA-binding domain-containing protein n=1 Tax=Cyclotella cryptica TaxID=29204 RepID=A0ABD3P4U9_9STRA